MYGKLLAVALCLGGLSANAANLADILVSSTHPFIKAKAVGPFAKFKVGDKANYILSVSSFSGTMDMMVTAATATDVTISQKAAILGQNQDIVEVIDPQTGAIKSVTVNGQKQTPPDPNDMQITSVDTCTLTVKAGTFPCQDVKFHTKSSNTDGEQWADINDVPIGGMLKMMTTEQGYPVTLELKSFMFAP